MSYINVNSRIAATGPAKTLFARIREALALRRQRAQLFHLSDAQLTDLGLTRHQADQEAARAAWDAPDHWKA